MHPPRSPLTPEKALSLFNTHTGETIRAAYWENGRYVTDALAGINRMLRDHRSGETHPIDPQLLDLLHALSRKLETRTPFHVISGYRSPTTNAALREQGRGVASGSLHIVGKAIDIRASRRGADRPAQLGAGARRRGRGLLPALGLRPRGRRPRQVLVSQPLPPPPSAP